MDRLREKLKEILEHGDFNEESFINELGFDSFSVVEFIEWINLEYGKNISLEEFRKFNKLRDLTFFLEKI